METVRYMDFFFKLVIFAGLVIIGFVLIIESQNYQRRKAAGNFTFCLSNCKNIGQTLKKYSGENNGKYPRRLTDLTPDYLRNIPSCPASGSNRGFIKSYMVSGDLKSFTFYCKGRHHKNVGVDSNYPQYNSRDDLIPR
ncbi:MAG: hypothetical protein K8T10_17825 [Candidatus Eremiobacteraeota bacterium]|nr:hypothetical protein [Candidatus Eremiobacteraeota bacterium]